MKKAAVAALIAAAFAFLVSLAAAETAGEASVLPESLAVIEADAFAGTSLDRVSLPESVTRIEDSAFAGNSSLTEVSLAESIEEIIGDPFSGSGNVTLSGPAGSYGRFWAEKHGFRFRLEVRLAARKEALRFIAAAHRREKTAEEAALSPERADPEQKDSRTGRTEGELKAAAYDGVAALYIQSRYFP